ncbi:MAG TPA: acyl-CoA dehydrogenase family protein [Jatrophihabitans sp.]|jgi:alkylation response protein AidB-like acyl-CoA dehydrogenase
MRWELTEEQQMFQEALRGWLEREAPSAAIRRWNDSGDPSPYERALTNESWLGVGVSEELAGQGGGLIELVLAAEEFARAGAPSSGWLATVLAAPALASRPDVGAAALGKGELAALVVTAGAPPDVPSSRVTFADGRLDGSVVTVLGADRARQLVVPVWTDGRPRLVLVESVAQGVAVSGRRLLDRSRTVAEVSFDAAVATVLEIDAGPVLASAALRAAVLVAADSLGAMDRMLDLAVDYSKQRHQFGAPIGSFQAVKHAAATILVAVEAARSIVYLAAAAVEELHPAAVLYAATAKAQVTASGMAAADSSLTMHGAIGYTWEYDLQLFYKRAMLDGYLFGKPELWNERLASALPLLPSN